MYPIKDWSLWAVARFDSGGDGGGGGGDGGGDGVSSEGQDSVQGGAGNDTVGVDPGPAGNPSTPADAIGQAEQGDTGATGPAAPGSVGPGPGTGGPVSIADLDTGVQIGVVAPVPNPANVPQSNTTNDQGGMPASMTQENAPSPNGTPATAASTNARAFQNQATWGNTAQVANAIFGLIAPAPLGLINGISGLAGGPTVGSVAASAAVGPPGTPSADPDGGPDGPNAGAAQGNGNDSPGISGGSPSDAGAGASINTVSNDGGLSAPQAALPTTVRAPRSLADAGDPTAVQNYWQGNGLIIPGLLNRSVVPNRWAGNLFQIPGILNS